MFISLSFFLFYKMENRPRITLYLSQPDKRLERAGKVVLCLMWLLVLASFFASPSVVPTHFNASGKVDNYGNKSTLLILPVIATLIYFGLTQLNKYPHVFNYMTTITKENAEWQYTLATRMLRFLKLSVLIVFTLLIVLAYLVAKGYINGLGIWFLPFTMITVLAPIVIVIYQSKQK